MTTMRTLTLRTELPADVATIRALTEEAFRHAPHSDGTEGAIIDSLRAAGALTLSLVAEADGTILGHCAVSPVSTGAMPTGWFGLGPVAVCPAAQRSGIGSAMIREGLERLKSTGARGCVVLGDPAYYRRFGFAHDPAALFEGVPPAYFMTRSFDGSGLSGAVRYHPAFFGAAEA